METPGPGEATETAFVQVRTGKHSGKRQAARAFRASLKSQFSPSFRDAAALIAALLILAGLSASTSVRTRTVLDTQSTARARSLVSFKKGLSDCAVK
jgi:hypothetical protein